MNNLTSKIFIDGGVPGETKEANLLFQAKFSKNIDGQTTNPTLIAKNLASVNSQQSTNNKLDENQALEEYKRIVREMGGMIPKGSVSIQVFANQETLADEMIMQARARRQWIPNSSIKVPCTSEGLKAANVLCREMPVNITLVFSQSQAAAVYEATKGAGYPVFISPFVGRLDDRGENGMDVIKNILKMFETGDGHVEVLTASTRNIEHVKYALFLKSDIITIPFKVFKNWAEVGFELPQANYKYEVSNMKEIPYQNDVVLGKNWQTYDMHHDLTDKGILAFWNDWTGLFNKQ
jgi:transaldolase